MRYNGGVLGVLLVIFSSFWGTPPVFAQDAVQETRPVYDFIPGEKIIFQDDFSRDPVGHFPAKWRLYPTYAKLDITDSIANTSAYPIKKQLLNGESILSIASDNHYFPIRPRIPMKNYLKDTFTIEFDFRMDDDQSDAAIVFFDELGANIFETRCLGTGEFISTVMRETHYSVDFPDSFNCTSWHHFAMSYIHGQIKLFIDKYRILLLPQCPAKPTNFILAGNSYTEGNPAVGFKKIRLATDIPNMFNKIITEKKFVTHAIYFQTNKYVIEPDSYEFLGQLADWLKKNPGVLLEIDGYTDNEGDAKTNLELSANRARAVKAALVSLHVDAARLTTNGFGQEHPVDTNDTPEGKAQNRRVEFIKQ